jgi:outer membrane receptor protein involved in Fe transport
MRLRNLAALVAVALLAALPAFAQEQRAAIEGVVKDSQGGAVVGATVVAKSTSGSSFEAVTDAAGTYRFAALPPGRYELTCSLSGFNPAKVENINLGLGQLLTINMTMAVGGVTETVQVIGESPLVDVKQSQRATNIRDEFIEKMPQGRNFTSLATQAPGANIEHRLGGLSIDGSSAAENKYVIDGVETNDLRTGIAAKDLVTDFVEEVQVKSSGYAAEYSGALGGVVNVITKSGTNSFKGSVWGYYSGDALGYARGPALGDSNRTPAYADGRSTLRRNLVDSTKAEYVTYDEDSVTQIEPGFSLGGPLSKDKVWFFVAYNPNFRSIDRTVTLVADGSQITKTQDRTGQMLSANLTSQLGAKTRARLAYNNSYTKVDGFLPALDGSDPVGSTYDIVQKFPNWSLSGNLDYTPSNNFYLSVRGGYFFQDTQEEGRPQGNRYGFSFSNIGMAGVPENLQHVTGYFDPATSNFETRKEQFTRLNFQTDATWFFNAGGQHTFKVGAQFDRLGNDVDLGETGHRVTLLWNRTLGGQRGLYGYYQVRSYGPDNPKLGFTTRGNVNSNNWGLFIQDSWTIANKLTLNLGLRTESENIPNFAQGEEFPQENVAEFGFGDKLAPRVGFSYDVKGDGRWKVYGSWGLFYDIVKLEMPRGSFGGDHWLEYYYALDTPNWPTLATSPSCPPACDGRLLRGPIDFRHPSFDYLEPDLKPYELEEATVGIEHELTPKVSLALRYVHKQINVAIEDVGSLDAQGNEIYVIGNPGFGLANTAFRFADGSTVPFPKGQRDYDAVEASFYKRMADNWSLRVSYLWSRLYGNYSGLGQADENGRISPNVGRNFDYPIMAFGEDGQAVFGPLPTDRPHQFKTQFIYDFPFNLSAGLNAYVASGVPITREAAFLAPNNFPVQYLGRESDGRMPTYSQFDVLLAQNFKLGGNKMLQINVNILNLLNQDTATAKYQTELEPGAGISVTEEAFYRGINTQALIAAQGLRQDPRFLQDSEFQLPREVRIGVRFSF